MKPGRRRRLLVRAAKLTRRQARKAREKLLREMPTYIERPVHFDPENVTIRFGGFEIPFVRASCSERLDGVAARFGAKRTPPAPAPFELSGELVFR